MSSSSLCVCPYLLVSNVKWNINLFYIHSAVGKNQAFGFIRTGQVWSHLLIGRVGNPKDCIGHDWGLWVIYSKIPMVKGKLFTIGILFQTRIGGFLR